MPPEIIIPIAFLAVFVLLFSGPLVDRLSQNEEQKVSEIKVAELPEQMAFFYARVPLCIWMILSGGMLFFLFQPTYISWIHPTYETPTGAMLDFLFLILLDILFGASLLMSGYRLLHINQPMITLLQSGFEFQDRFYPWESVEKIEVVQVKLRMLRFSLKTDCEDNRKNKVYVGIGDIRPRFLSTYVDIYFSRYKNAEQAVE